MKTRTAIIALLTLGVLAVAHRLPAQSTRTRQVAVALVDTLSAPGLRAEILRFSDPAKPDVILLRSGDAGPTDLAAAIVSYRASSRRTPAMPGAVGRIAVSSHTARVPAVADLRTKAAEMLATVRRAPLGKVGNYGRGRWSTFEVTVHD